MLPSRVTGGVLHIFHTAAAAVRRNCYPMLRLDQTPEIETHAAPSATKPLGAGEQGVAPVAAAVLNAVFAATGRRVRHLPITAADIS